VNVPLLSLIIVRAFLVAFTTLAVNPLSNRSSEMPQDLLKVVAVRHVAFVLLSVPYDVVDDII
jgi:hypothetical protein